MSSFGENNPNWRGGKSVASNGYVLVRVGHGHHLADVRGYAYEHRVVAETVIGRRLRRGEVVHHIDHDKTNNSPENLKVCPTVAWHRAEHRMPGKRLRLPDEPNPSVPCACGCGEHITRYDDSGRTRRFVSGHNNQGVFDRPTDDQQKVLDFLRHGPAKRSEIAHALGITADKAGAYLHKLQVKCLAEKVERARWVAVGTKNVQQDAGTNPDLDAIAWCVEEWKAGRLRDSEFESAIISAADRIMDQGHQKTPQFESRNQS